MRTLRIFSPRLEIGPGATFDPFETRVVGDSDAFFGQILKAVRRSDLRYELVEIKETVVEQCLSMLMEPST